MFKSFRFQTKIFMFYSLILLLIIAIVLAIFYAYIINMFEKQASENINQLNIKTSNQIDNMLVESDRIALYVVSNPVIRNALANVEKNDVDRNYFETAFEQNRIVTETLISINVPSSQSYIRTSIYNIRKDYISMGIPDIASPVLSDISDYDYVKWYSSMLAAKKKLILPPHPDFWTNNKNEYMISVVREIFDPITIKSYGIVEVQRPYSSLVELLENGLSSGRKILVFTHDNEVVYPIDIKNTDLDVNHYIKATTDTSKSIVKTKNPTSRKNELISYIISDFSHWKVIMIEPENNYSAPVKILGNTVLLIAIGLLLITMAAVFIITNYLTKPLKLLRNSVRKVTLDNLSIAIEQPDNSNEITELNQSFHKMFQRLEESMNELVQTRSHEMKAHMIALQSQMDPHFLYNMLAIISASGREAGATTITNICSKLSSMLRYISSYNEDSVPINNEVEHAVNYLEIMKIRYEDQFVYTIHIDEELYEHKIDIPKLTIQPLLENCFKHGFKKVITQWELLITAGIQNSFWYIEVCDNGIGFDKEIIVQLLKRVDDFIQNPSTNIKDLKLGGMGLINTLVRLKLLYKDEAIIKIENGSNGGTRITIGGSIK